MLNTFWPVLFSVFIVLDPVGLVPLYISLTSRMGLEERNRTIVKATATSFVVLSIFILVGRYILDLLGIEPGSFFIAGGIMLFLVSLDMLFGAAKRTKTSKEEETDDAPVAIFPLAIPMLAGPGTITTIILFSSANGGGWMMTGMLFAAVFVSLGTAALFMYASQYLLRLLGKTGVSVIERIMGILLAGMSVQFIYDGLVKLGVIAQAIPR